MKIVIAPSKTMKPQKVDWSLTPILFEKETNYLHQQLSHYNDEQLCELMKISYKQALKVYDYYHQKQASYPALAFFSGTVFKPGQRRCSGTKELRKVPTWTRAGVPGAG